MHKNSNGRMTTSAKIFRKIFNILETPVLLFRIPSFLDFSTRDGGLFYRLRLGPSLFVNSPELETPPDAVLVVGTTASSSSHRVEIGYLENLEARMEVFDGDPEDLPERKGRHDETQ